MWVSSTLSVSESHHYTSQAQTLSPSLHSDGDVDTAALSPPRDPVVLGPIVPGGRGTRKCLALEPNLYCQVSQRRVGDADGFGSGPRPCHSHIHPVHRPSRAHRHTHIDERPLWRQKVSHSEHRLSVQHRVRHACQTLQQQQRHDAVPII